ncbi:MAG: His-Xaa-Ser system protein HxsD [bacterium]|nr:His-Xaa-Ser system protein HxsD [bacterium]
MDIGKNFEIDSTIYSKDVLLRVCHSFLDNYYLYVDSDKENKKWVVTVKNKEFSPIDDLEKLEGEFNNSLINESFRESLIDKTKTVKEIIVARALFGADSADEFDLSSIEKEYAFLEEKIDDYIDDPLGIAVPWEEKYGNENSTGSETKEVKDENKD